MCDEYGDLSIIYMGFYIGYLCYFFVNCFYNYLFKDVKGFKVCLYDEFVKLKWIIGIIFFIIVWMLVVLFIDMDFLVWVVIIVVILVLLIYWLKNWDYYVEKFGKE